MYSFIASSSAVDFWESLVSEMI